MCVIIAKNKSDRLPTIEELTNCFNKNEDGSGFMYTDNGKVIIDKGYMKKDDFINHYKKLCIKYDDFKNKCLVIHCRIGTAGSNNQANTHPYPLTNSINKLHKLKTTCKIGVAHNGIIKNYDPGKNLHDINDTQLFISTYLYNLYINYNKFYKNDEMLKGIKYITNSKFALLNNDDTLITIGDFVNHEGLKFSNTSYEKLTYNYNYNYNHNYNYYDWDDYWDSYYSKNKSYLYQKEKEKEKEKEKADPKINYENFIDIPENYLLEYNDVIHRITKDYYVIDMDTNYLYKYNDIKKDFIYISNDFIIYNDCYDVVEVEDLV